MKRNLIFLVVFFIVSLTKVLGQDYSRLKIQADVDQMRLLGQAGVAIDHGIYRADHYFITDFSAAEKQIIKDLAIPFEVLIEYIEAY